MTKRAPFKQSDIERAAKALQALGKNVTGVEVEPDGSFRILTGTASLAPAHEPQGDAWDRAMAKWSRSA